VMRGLYYHVGAPRPRRIASEGLTTLDSDEIYITNKRVIFNGARRNLTLELDSLLSSRPSATASHSRRRLERVRISASAETLSSQTLFSELRWRAADLSMCFPLAMHKRREHRAALPSSK
jgi:hypothetical protein